MTNYTELSGKPNEFIAMTGLSVDEFNSLLFISKKLKVKANLQLQEKKGEINTLFTEILR